MFLEFVSVQFAKEDDIGIENGDFNGLCRDVANGFLGVGYAGREHQRNAPDRMGKPIGWSSVSGH